MAKAKFDFTDKENLIRIEGWARDGRDDKEIAKIIGYNETYFSELKGKIPELSKALKKGRAPLDIVVESKLYKNATGYKTNVQQAIKLKRVSYDEEGKRTEEEFIEVVSLEQEVPPNTTAQIFWLKNRKPEQWRDKVNTDITTNGKDIAREITIIDKTGTIK